MVSIAGVTITSASAIPLWCLGDVEAHFMSMAPVRQTRASTAIAFDRGVTRQGRMDKFIGPGSAAGVPGDGGEEIVPLQ